MRNFLTHPFIRFSIIISLSTVGLYLAFRTLVWEAVLQAFQQFNQAWLGPVIGLIIFSDSLHVLRWQRLLKPTEEIPLAALYEAVVLGRFTNFMSPLNVGALVRAYRIKQRFTLNLLPVMGSLTTEAMVGSLVFWASSIVVLLVVPLPPNLAALRQQVWLGVGVLSLILGLLLLAGLISRRYTKILSQFLSPQWQARITGLWQQFRQGLWVNRSWQETSLIVLYSVGIRLTFGLTTLCVARGFGIDLSYLTYLFLDILVSLAHMIGGHILGLVGTLETALTYSLSLYNVPKETGLSIALMLNASFILPSAVLGFIFFLRSDLTWQTLTKLRKQGPSPRPSQEVSS